MAEEVRDQEQWLAVIARSLAYLCIHATDLRDAELAPKALLLESVGLTRRDIAALLNTTEESVRVTVHVAKRGRKRGGRKRKK